MILHRGDIIAYDNNKLGMGIIVANDSCTLFSPTFQVVPFYMDGTTFHFNVKEEFLLDCEQIVGKVGIAPTFVMKELNDAILQHHQIKKGGVLRIGDVFLADIPLSYGSIQCGVRPVVIVSEDIANEKVHVIPLTTKLKKSKLPTHLLLKSDETFLLRDSMVLAEAEMLLETSCLGHKLGELSEDIMANVLEVIKIQHGIAV